MRAQLIAGLRALLVLTLLCGVAFPLAVTAVAQVAFHDKADGSLVHRDGKVVGSSLIGQTFTGAEYFHGRPSAAGAAAAGVEGADADDLTQVASGASNLGPTNPELLDTVTERVDAYRAENDLARDVRVPVDAVTASGSGLDPQISVANARLQAPRVAEARGMDTDAVLALVDKHTGHRSLGFLGEDGVNVLALNLDLDRSGGT
jgi:K+-transporting ATPase ATPase C chain